MKKLLSLLVVGLIAVSLVFALGEVEKPKGISKLVILNNALDGLNMTDQCYNAKEYHKAYSLSEIMDDNLWFASSDDVVTVAFADLYEDHTKLDEFRRKFVSLSKDNKAYDYDIFVGQAQKESYDVKYKGYTKFGSEVMVFAPEDGWNLAELFEFSGATGDKFTVMSLSDSTYEFTKEELADLTLMPNEANDSVNLLKGGEVVLKDVYDIVEAGVRNNKVESGRVVRFFMLLTAKGVYGAEPKYLENRAGTFYKAASVISLFEKYNVQKCDTVKVTSYKDGYSQNEDWAQFTAKYITYQEPTSAGVQKDFFTLGKTQERNKGVVNIGTIILESEAFAFIGYNSITAYELIQSVGMVDATSYRFTYKGGDIRTYTTEQLKTLTLDNDNTIKTIEFYL